MLLPSVSLAILENLAVGLVSGFSTMAAISLLISSRYGFPKSGVGNIIVQTNYIAIRTMHGVLLVFAFVGLLLFGWLDGNDVVTLAYSVKFAVLLILLAYAVLLKKKIFPVASAAPIIVGMWYFFVGYHTFVATTASVPALGWTVFWYVVVIGVVFFVLRRWVRCLREKASKVNDEAEKKIHTGE